ncbi:unnamed protein product [Arabis nemorensis]|uniref:KIB1-4 beta-propeller domain-containing protein n=1 Tax=Arabis nemorensis TaxID=586526 RepID=A0A565B3U8_9BRAS|nr:unnamed protein product [Arabis nemorensis]
MSDSNKKTKSKQPVLAVDLIRSILERLSFVDFHSARCVSSEWYSTSKSCHGSSSSRRKILKATTTSVHRIPLPSLESVDGWQIGHSGRFSYERSKIGKAVLWVDEKSRDYFVVWNFDCLVAYHKKGDANNSWKVLKPLKNEGFYDMVLKERKLYVLSDGRGVKVFDFSYGDPPTEFCVSSQSPWYNRSVNLVLTLSGELVLIISNMGRHSFNVFKLDPTSSKWIKIESIGDEALLLDQGITVAAKDGVMKNCIYFSNHHFRRYEGTNLGKDDIDNGICVYNIQTQKVVHKFPYLIDSRMLVGFSPLVVENGFFKAISSFVFC